jgi:CRISPR-associated protein Cas5d
MPANEQLEIPCSRWRPLEMVVAGDWACFTRPEMKVERVSYPVMTPSAARGILEAIYWARDVVWKVQEIWVLKPVRWFSIVRSELTKRQSAHKALTFWRKTGGNEFARGSSTFRHTLGLRDVEYLLRADVYSRGGAVERTVAIRDQFRRRLERGAYFHHPYLGCREFTARFWPSSGAEVPISWSESLGLMLYDMQYSASAEALPVPSFFDARIECGILKITSDIVKANSYAPNISR